MIYTLTLSPSLDYMFNCDNPVKGQINHAHHAVFYPGGKGINVSMCLTNLKVANTALGFLGGTVGDIIQQGLLDRGVNADFIRIEGNTRVNVKVKENKEETAFNLDGPAISENELTKLYERLRKLELGDILIMGGSTGLIHRSIYSEIIAECNKKGILCVLDASGVGLKEGVKGKPFLIKPNLDELSELVGRNVSIDEVPAVGREISNKYGINYVLVSLGSEGACLITPSEVLKDKYSVKGKKIISTVGAGDCMLAGFMMKLAIGAPVATCLHYANMCGASKCVTGHIPSLEEIGK